MRLSTLRTPFKTGHRDILTLVDESLLRQGLLAYSLVKCPRLAQRMALGRAHHEQVRSFELCLATGQIHQLPDDALASAFSRYLPYAIVFNLTDRWVSLFAELGASRGAASGSTAAGSADLDTTAWGSPSPGGTPARTSRAPASSVTA